MTVKVIIDDDMIDTILARCMSQLYEIVLPVINQFANQIGGGNQIRVEHDPETGLHIIPKQDVVQHGVSVSCWCQPEKDSAVSVYMHHHSATTDEWAEILEQLRSPV